MTRLKKSCDSQLPITGPLLYKIFIVLPLVFIEGCIFIGILWFFCELTLSTKNNVESILQLSDDWVESAHSRFYLRIRRSKSDQQGRGVILEIKRWTVLSVH